jgi:hypothetical protein
MSFVEDVSRSNRGWSEELKMRKIMGRKRTARANLLDRMVVRVPPPVPRGALESLNFAEMCGRSGVGSATKPPPPKATGLFEEGDPGCDFDHSDHVGDFNSFQRIGVGC